VRPLAIRLRRFFRPRASVLSFLVVLALVVSLGAAMVVTTIAAPAGPSPSVATASSPLASVHPLSGGDGIDREIGRFFDSNSTFAPANYNGSPCEGYTFYANSSTQNYSQFQGSCASGPQDPSSVYLGGTSLGVAYSSVTNETVTASCPGGSKSVVSGVFFQTSNDSGAQWGNAVGIGNATCSYLQAFDPSVAISGHTIYAAFVETNESGATSPLLPPLDNLSSDAIGFTSSTNNGSSFSRVVSLTTAGTDNLTDPQVAAFGDTVYVVYVNTANWTNLTLTNPVPTPLPFYPTSVNIVYSTDGGTSWNGPIILPGENATYGYMADSPSLAVNSLGQLAVSYATNRSCIVVLGYCDDYGESIVVSVSSTNGTSWSTPVTVAPAAGEYACQYDDPLSYSCLPGQEEGPHSAIAFDPANPSRVNVVYTGSYYTWNTTTGEGSGSGTTNIGYGQALYGARSIDTGARWTDSIIAQPTSGTGTSYDAIVDPSVTIAASGTVYVSFAWLNDTYCNGCNAAFYEYTSYWVGASADGGATWSLDAAQLTNVYYFELDEDWYGLTSAVTVTTTGPVGVFGEGLGYQYTEKYIQNLSGTVPSYYYWFNYTYATELLAVFPSQAAPIAINFTESGLPANTTWGFTLSGNEFSSNDTTIQVTDVPTGVSLTYEPGVIPIAYWTEWAAVSSVPDVVAFPQAGNVSVAFAVNYGVAFHMSPVAPSGFVGGGTALSFLYVELDIDVGGVYVYWEWSTEYYAGTWYNETYSSLSFPWYFPHGTNLSVTTGLSGDLPIGFVYGNGNGSVTGIPSSSVASVNGPINETYFAGVVGSYGLSFVPVGLPAGAAYSFQFEGTTYDGTAPAAVTVSNVYTGAYPLSDVEGTSSTPGELYYAPTAVSVVDVPVQTEILLNFTTEVDTTGTLGVASFQAVGLATGDFWQLQFNGTTYGSSTPWINVTTHPGTFGVASFPITASANESVAYAASGFGPSLSVSPGTTYPVNFSLAYRVDVSASVGGTVTGLGPHWLTPGTAASYSANASVGFRFLGWAGGGSGSYTGTSSYANFTVRAPTSEAASFEGQPGNRYNLTLTETGLPAGTWWTVTLNGTSHSSDSTSLAVPDLYSCSAGAPGQYAVSVPYVYLNGTSGVRFIATGYPSSTCTTGVTSLAITFSAEYLVTADSSGSGNATVSSGGPSTATSAWVPAGSSIGIAAQPDSGYAFAGWLGTGPGSYSGPDSSVYVAPTGPVTEVANFQLATSAQPPVYWVSFMLDSSLASGTSWSVTFNGTTYTSTAASILVTGLPAGTYPLSVDRTFSPDRTVEYTPHAIPSSLTLVANRTVNLTYATGYWVTLQASPGGTISPTQSGYYAAATVLTLVASPSAGESFVGWVGTGAGAYTGSAANTTATVSGPISEVATFAPSSSSASSTSFLGSTAGIAVLAIVGLVAGLAVGLLIARKRPPASTADPVSEPGAPE
jgi:hypothetical protein